MVSRDTTAGAVMESADDGIRAQLLLVIAWTAG